jgi:hypothetical protein
MLGAEDPANVDLVKRNAALGQVFPFLRIAIAARRRRIRTHSNELSIFANIAADLPNAADCGNGSFWRMD